jgi:hypothetical protein
VALLTAIADRLAHILTLPALAGLLVRPAQPVAVSINREAASRRGPASR